MTTSNVLRIDYDPSIFSRDEETMDKLPAVEEFIDEQRIRDELERPDYHSSNFKVQRVVVYKGCNFALAYFSSREDALEAHQCLTQTRADNCLLHIHPDLITQQSVYVRNAKDPRLSAPRVKALEEANCTLAQRIKTRRAAASSREGDCAEGPPASSASHAGGGEQSHSHNLQAQPARGQRQQRQQYPGGDPLDQSGPFAQKEVIYKASPGYDSRVNHPHQAAEIVFRAGGPPMMCPQQAYQAAASTADRVGGYPHQVPMSFPGQAVGYAPLNTAQAPPYPHDYGGGGFRYPGMAVPPPSGNIWDAALNMPHDNTNPV